MRSVAPRRLIARSLSMAPEASITPPVKIAVVACLLMAALADTASAQTWSAEQQEIWKFEEKQWQMARDKDLSWIETMVHPNLSYWETGEAMPQNKASRARRNKFHSPSQTVLEQELFPISIATTGNVAVAQYGHRVVRASGAGGPFRDPAQSPAMRGSTPPGRPKCGTASATSRGSTTARRARL